jgi:putative ABC transport system substrate-binding protein
MVSPPFIHACDKTYFDGINTSHEHNGDRRSWQQQILALAARNALPTSFSNSDFVVAGGLMSYGPNQIESYREAGTYTARILKGEKPAELPVLISTMFNFAINVKTAKALGLTIPPSMLALTTMLIE